MAIRYGALAVVFALALPPIPALRAPLLCAFWTWSFAASLRYAVSRRTVDLLPSALNLALGLASLVVVSQLMIWLRADRPTLVTQGLAVGVFVATLRAPTDASWFGRSRTQYAQRLAWLLRHPQARLHAIVLIVACAAWLISLTGADLAGMNDYGLLSVLPPLWYVAVTLAVVGTTTAVLAQRGRDGMTAVAVAGILLIIMMLHATPALLYQLPRYTWTYKHLGVVDHIAQHHNFPRLLDIYYNWPGFFSAAQWLSATSSLSPSTLARFSPPAFEVMNAAAVWYLAGAFTKDRRRIAMTTLLFVVANWIGQDYFAPQALSYVLALTLVALFVRVQTGAGRPNGPQVQRRVWVQVGLVWIAVVTSHQLSPVVVLVTLALLQVLLRWRSWWPLAAMLATEVIWVSLAWPYLRTATNPLLSFDPLHGSGSDVGLTGTGYTLRVYAVRILYFGLFAAALGYASYRARRSRAELAVGVAALGPALVLLAQDYGGEGQLRTYLFALPFLCLLIAGAILRFRRWAASKRVATGMPFACVLIILTLFLPAYFGQEMINRVLPGDIAANRWFENHAGLGTEAIYLAPNTPSRLTARYLSHPFEGNAQPALISKKALRDHFNAATAVSLIKPRPAAAYLVFTPSQLSFGEYYGLFSADQYRQLTLQLDKSPALRLVFRESGGSVWRLVR